MDYKKAIKLLRAALSVSQQELAESADLSPSLLSRIEAGERKLSEKNKKKIALAFDFPPSLIDLFAIEPKKRRVEEKEILEIGKAIVKLSRMANEKAAQI
jgi:transcriptional regulator with XRE-family HTH domain